MSLSVLRNYESKLKLYEECKCGADHSALISYQQAAIEQKRAELRMSHG